MYRIGIDLGGTNIVAAVVDNNYQIIAKASCKTALPRPAQEIVADICRLSVDAVAKAGITFDDVLLVGIGSPGTCNRATGVVEYANNLGFENLPLQKMVEESLGKPVYIENDANAAAYGEYVAGAAKGTDSCVCVTLGTGVGSGIILDGMILSGSNSAGGELGHTVIVAGGEPCTCGRKGCWESYSSATALIRQTRRAMEENKDSAMWELAPTLDLVDGRTAFDGMRQGDAAAKAVVDRYIELLGCGVANVINIFQPDVVCIGGGISKEGSNLIDPLTVQVEKERYSKFCKKQTRLVRARLGNDAGLIGAAFLDQAE